MAWKAIARFCARTGHQKRNVECQDYAAWERLKDNAIVGVVADGGGSAKYAAQGAKIAVKTTIASIKRSLNQINPVLVHASSVNQYHCQPWHSVNQLCRRLFSLLAFKHPNQFHTTPEISLTQTQEQEIFNLALK